MTFSRSPPQHIPKVQFIGKSRRFEVSWITSIYRQAVQYRRAKSFAFNASSGMSVLLVGRASREPPVPLGGPDPNASRSVKGFLLKKSILIGWNGSRDALPTLISFTPLKRSSASAQKTVAIRHPFSGSSLDALRSSSQIQFDLTTQETHRLPLPD